MSTNYKEVQTRVDTIYGRYAVEVFITGRWVPVALREKRSVAETIEQELYALLQNHQDEECQTKSKK